MQKLAKIFAALQIYCYFCSVQRNEGLDKSSSFYFK